MHRRVLAEGLASAAKGLLGRILYRDEYPWTPRSRAEWRHLAGFGATALTARCKVFLATANLFANAR